MAQRWCCLFALRVAHSTPAKCEKLQAAELWGHGEPMHCHLPPTFLGDIGRNRSNVPHGNPAVPWCTLRESLGTEP
ncbi:hypothetical protein CONLIGDRAFT_632372 [Coniochaeta ligniaria NRRL 30616]|uniref:Uncharacterized protein n=1 Tax=Coniochaeta ligniaria NRRL 30616 TaxID=1408157 RepID=A0A1J7JRD6_9PEZI|nr:hypothetical protein CONLIGDRAFT_632372 [Coniochaeta ligniaria NRRL 30616]